MGQFRMRKPKYPFVICDDHKLRLGYVVCTHILNGKAQDIYVSPPTTKQEGSICCEKYGKDHPLDELTLICQKCAEDLFLEEKIQ